MPPSCCAPRTSIGAIRKGLDADLLLVDGNPLEDIARHRAHFAGGVQGRAAAGGRSCSSRSRRQGPPAGKPSEKSTQAHFLPSSGKNC